jgi:hypothetical protein
VVEADGAFEDVFVVGVVGAGGVGERDVEDGAQFGEEELIVGALRAAGGVPAGDEMFNRVGCRGSRWSAHSAAPGWNEVMGGIISPVGAIGETV